MLNAERKRSTNFYRNHSPSGQPEWSERYRYRREGGHRRAIHTVLMRPSLPRLSVLTTRLSRCAATLAGRRFRGSCLGG